MTGTQRYRYQGLDRLGVARHGTVAGFDLERFVMDHHRAGWRHLTVDLDGVKVAEITSAPRGGGVWIIGELPMD